jgi:hypothetical protein
MTRTLGSPIGEEGHRRFVHLRIETSYEFYLSTRIYFHHHFLPQNLADILLAFSKLLTIATIVWLQRSTTPFCGDEYGADR